MIKELLKHAKSSLKYTLITPCLVALEVALEVMIPYVTQALIDNGINKGDMKYVGIASVILLLLAGMGMVLGILSGWSSTKGSTGFAKNLMDDMYANIQNFSFSNIDKFSTSSLITRLTTDVMNVRQSYQMTSRLATRCPIMLVASIIMAFMISPKIALIYLGVAPVLVICLILIIKYAFPLFEKVFKSYDKMNKVVRENVKGVRVVKSFNSQGKEIEKFEDASGDIYKNYSRAERLLALNSPLMQICIYTCMLLIAWLCSKAMVGGTLGEGALVALISYTMSILMSLMMFSMVFVMITMSRASAERIVEVLKEEPSIVNPENPIYEVPNGDIEFKNVGFSYIGDSNKECMSNINLKINNGEMIGILGGTGSGKTTLISLLPRLYDATSGEVIVGGHNVKEYDIKSLRDSVSVVLQKNVLFSGSLRDNMKWGNPNVTDEQIAEALEIASATDFVSNFKDGYDHYIEQGGANLSGGQKQRLCIARALIKDPKILILDDSTSAVDTATDKKIKQGLRDTKPNTTKLIIAQRISSVQDADKIIVIDNGKINGIGTHEELMANNTIYQEVYQSQVKGGNNHDNN